MLVIQKVKGLHQDPVVCNLSTGNIWSVPTHLTEVGIFFITKLWITNVLLT